MITEILSRIQLVKPYSVSSLNGALLLRISSWTRWQKTAQAVADEMLDRLNEAEKPSYVILDLSDYDPSIEDIVLSFNTYLRGDKAWISHPNLKELFLLTHDSVLSRTNTYTDSFQVGQLPVKVFHKLETAMTFIDRRL